MEFGLREVLIGLGFLVIAGILFDGWRRMRRSKMGELGMPTEMGGSCDDWEYYRGELPNGGARKIPLREKGQGEQGQFRAEFSEYDEAEMAGMNFPASERDEPYLDDATLEADDFGASDEMDSISRPRRVQQNEVVQPQAQRRANQSSDAHKPSDDLRSPNLDQSGLFEDDEMLIRSRQEQERKLASHYRAEKNPSKSSKPKSTHTKASSEQPQQQSKVQGKETLPHTEEERSSQLDRDLKLEVSAVQDVIVVNVMARPGQEFPGADLVRVLLSCGFRHGDMNIFHRYEQHSGKGGLLFSLANVVEPGTFDLDNMEDFSTPGVCMFMKLPGPKRSVAAFDLMIDSARKIASLLGGDIKDENHSVMTQQAAEHYRQRVLDFERRLLSHQALQR